MEQILNYSKLTMPRLTPKFIERKHLDDLFTANSYKKVTLLRTPAGYGKTTLLSAYFRKINAPVAWITLDERDNDLILFWTYLVTAINKNYRILPSQMHLSSMQLSNQSILKIGIYQLIEELTSYHHPIQIVLDDYHFILDERIHDFLTRLIEYLPENVHIYITSRTAVPFPLAKWRVRQWVQELDLSHLKFTQQDTKDFLLQTTNKQFNDSHIQSIFAKTEGWVSGLLLTTLAYENEPMPLVNSHSYTTDFLWQEIIYKQSLGIQEFLLKTSLLQELDPAICDELTERTDSAVLLEQLEGDGLFIFKMQSTSPTYRYHHLFTNALQVELAKRYDADVITGIAKKAAFIYFAKDELFTAIEFAMRYKLYDVASKWIDEHHKSILSSRQTGLFIRWIQILREESIPLSYETLISGFIVAISSLQFELAHELMDELEELQLVKQWMDNPKMSDLTNLFIRTKAYFLVGQGDKLPEVLSLLQTQLFKKSLTSSTWSGLDISYNNYEINLLRMGLASKGKLISKEEALKVIQLFRYSELNMLAVAPYIFAVGTAMFFELNEITEAEKELAFVIEESHKKDTADLYVPMYILKAKMYIMQGLPLSAQAMLQQVEEKVSEKHWKNALKIMQARCHLENGELERAESLLDATKSFQPFWRLTYARFLLQSDLNEEALHTVIQVKTEAQQEGQLATIIEASVLEVICYYQMNNHHYAYNSLNATFQLAAPYGYIRTFLDEKKMIPIIQRYLKDSSYVETWGSAFQSYFTVLKQHMPIVNVDKQAMVALTPREKDIFRLIIAGAKNREIASKLNLSEGTVRVYITALYSKIGVTSRVQALLYAQLNPSIL